MSLFCSSTTLRASEFERTAVLALRLAQRVLPEYAARTSRKCFTQRQLAALVLVRGAFNLTYRALAELLLASPPLVEALGLKRIPHFTTIEGFANRPDVQQLMQQMLTQLLEMQGSQTPSGQRPDAGMDSTGVQPTTASVHFQRRKFGHAQAPYRAFAKLSVVVLCASLSLCAFMTDWGPSADLKQGAALVQQACQRLQIGALYADAGYDSEPLHRLCREQLGVESFIPPVVRARDGGVHTPHRAKMTELPEQYGRRWLVESFFSALKRRTGQALRARGKVNPLNELAVRTVAYAIRR